MQYITKNWILIQEGTTSSSPIHKAELLWGNCLCLRSAPWGWGMVVAMAQGGKGWFVHMPWIKATIRGKISPRGFCLGWARGTQHFACSIFFLAQSRTWGTDVNLSCFSPSLRIFICYIFLLPGSWGPGAGHRPETELSLHSCKCSSGAGPPGEFALTSVPNDHPQAALRSMEEEDFSPSFLATAAGFLQLCFLPMSAALWWCAAEAETKASVFCSKISLSPSLKPQHRHSWVDSSLSLIQPLKSLGEGFLV